METENALEPPVLQLLKTMRSQPDNQTVEILRANYRDRVSKISAVRIDGVSVSDSSPSSSR